MLLLLFLPIFYVVAGAHRYLQLFAPSNVLIARVRSSPPRCLIAVLLMALAYALVGAMHFLSTAIENGAPGWLNLLVLVAAWDAIKFALLSMQSGLRVVVQQARRSSIKLYGALSAIVHAGAPPA